MKKSVYSLVLADAVVEAIDQMAYRKGTSRSNLINQILAEQVSCITPEMRMRDIFGQLERLVSDTFQIQQQPSDAMLSLKSSLKYKYKPTIRYSVEINRQMEDTVGELRVAFRTQSTQLLAVLKDFFVLWANLEHKYIARYFAGRKISYTIDGGRLTRSLMMPDQAERQTDEALGEAIAEYITMFDDVLKTYFSYADNPAEAARKAEERYCGYLKQGIRFI